MKKKIITHLIAAYFGAGIFSAAMLMQAIPAMNVFGGAVQMALWPAMVYCAPKKRGCNPLGHLPEWTQRSMFTFD